MSPRYSIHIYDMASMDREIHSPSPIQTLKTDAYLVLYDEGGQPAVVGRGDIRGGIAEIISRVSAFVAAKVRR